MNCSVGENSCEWVPWTTRKPNHAINPKGNLSWIFIRRTDAESEAPILWPPDVKSLTHLKRSWCWERLKAGGERDDRGWDGSMASPTQWTCVWARSGRWWRTGKLGVLQSMGLQRVGQNLGTKQQQNRQYSCTSRFLSSHSYYFKFL